MQMDNSQLGDVTLRDVAGTITSVSVSVTAQNELLAELLRRVARLERATITDVHIVRLNAAVTMALLTSALYRYAAGNRRLSRRGENAT